MEIKPAYQRLGKKVFWVFVFESSGFAISMIIIWLALLVIEALGLKNIFISDNILTLVILVVFLLVILAIGIAFLFGLIKYFSYEYVLDENALRISLGILNKTETSIPYRQIQDVDIDRTLIHRFFGVSRLAILTAGEDGVSDEGKDNSEGAIPLLEKAQAEDMREELLKRANIQKITTVSAVV